MMTDVLTLIACACYAAFLIWCLYHWNKLQPAPDAGGLAQPSISVIVPVRDEEANIEGILNSLNAQSYPYFEVIIVDDHSSDRTVELASKWISVHTQKKFILLSSEGNSKKDALSYGIFSSTGEWIVTTDADCRMKEHWLTVLARCFTPETDMVAGPVTHQDEHTFLKRIQSAEYDGLTGMSGAGFHARLPLFCSGANLAFRKLTFTDAGGYAHSTRVSGDDTQLMRKIAQRGAERIRFVKDERAVVTSVSRSNANELFRQRRRWASKIPSTLSPFTISVALLAWMVHLLFLIQIIKAFTEHSFFSVILSWILIALPEVILLTSVKKFFGKRIQGFLIILIQPFYALYIVATGLISPFMKFTWKGRTVR